MQWLAVAVGGALGALGRYGLNALIYQGYSGKFPLGTLCVNVLGSVAIGVLYVVIVERYLLPAMFREFLMIGLLGAFTTFSTFSLDNSCGVRAYRFRVKHRMDFRFVTTVFGLVLWLARHRQDTGSGSAGCSQAPGQGAHFATKPGCRVKMSRRW